MSTAMKWLGSRVRTGTDEGSISVFVAFSIVGLLLIVGLVADGGLKVRAVQEADALAAEAARAAGQSIDAPAAVAGQVRVDRQAAASAALAFLAEADAPGSVSVAPDGESIDVIVTLTRPTAFVSLIGITHVTVTGRASATLVHAVTGVQP
ncbi:pilus assembly protein TadG-related protein [Isoptericola sp. b490]|uniref:pilus assembly protein TadG-related protein n=1 Tax=Actinotalea lenta TaxID=3064654 RepID=UPI002712895B|nr:pilus assembly protein TadG-related protein [Isoptericola sp. b490]MDO8119701.1 pilus assembly protein TadG-related protein [Isoptericola sp. b490]